MADVRIILILMFAGIGIIKAAQAKKTASLTPLTSAPPSAKVCDTRKTKNGECCVFPFTYLGNTFYDCTTKNLGKAWCATTADFTSNSKAWGECANPPKPIFDMILESNEDKTSKQARNAAGVQLFQGDIVVDAEIRKFVNSRGLTLPSLPGSRKKAGSRKKRAVMRNERARWVDSYGRGRVPYVIEASNNHARGVIMRAMRHWESKVPCLKFVPYRSGSGKYLSFFAGGGCYSMVGRQGNSGRQKISIGRGCETLGVVAHEIGHALGFWHEQSRPDRDKYVTINWGNIQQGVAFNFHKYDTRKINSRGVPYDYNSLMHYSSTAFANRRGVYTIVGKDGRTNLGQRYGLSAKDIIQANKLYCGKTGPKPPTKPPRPATTKPKPGCSYQDNHRWCPYWKSKGFCITYSSYMNRSCQKSCKCKQTGCVDKFRDCPGWKTRGYCNAQSKYSAYVRVYCKKSCNTC